MSVSSLIPPDGYFLVDAGKIKRGDRAWVPSENSWRTITGEDRSCLGDDVDVYFGVARKIRKPG